MKEIELFSGEIALVDDLDYEYLNQFSWHLIGKGYANRFYSVNNRQFNMLMHIEVLLRHNVKIIGQTDHVDQNKINNQFNNLRITTQSNNRGNIGLFANNTTGFKGVYYISECNKYRSILTRNKLRCHLGYFDTPEKAAMAYDRVARRFFKEFAFLNFPREGERGLY